MASEIQTVPNSTTLSPHNGQSLSNNSGNLKAVSQTLDRSFNTVPTGVTVADCEALVTASKSSLPLATPVEATDYAKQLLGSYPAREVNDAQAYAMGISAMLSAYPAKYVRAVCNPVTGLPSRLKWLPTLAETKEALEGEKLRRERIIANAMWVMRAANEKRDAAELEARISAGRKTQEERAQQVKELLGRFVA